MLQGIVFLIHWEEAEDSIRSGHCNPTEFQKDSLRIITISDEQPSES